MAMVWCLAVAVLWSESGGGGDIFRDRVFRLFRLPEKVGHSSPTRRCQVLLDRSGVAAASSQEVVSRTNGTVALLVRLSAGWGTRSWDAWCVSFRAGIWMDAGRPGLCTTGTLTASSGEAMALQLVASSSSDLS
jgi:hypothetical protein